MRYTEDGLYPALEAALKKAKQPLDCQALFDMPSVKEHAASANRVSDYLGNMWRKGLVVRLPAPKEYNNRSRWAYAWKGPKTHSKLPEVIAATEGAIEYAPRIIADRPKMVITEDGSVVTIELPGFIIQIRQTP